MSGEAPERVDLDVPPGAAGERIDRFLAGRLDLPRNRIQQWIREGLVLVDGAPVRASHGVLSGQRITCDPPLRAQPEDLRPEPGELVVLYRDEHLVVLDKPADLAVHPGAGRRTGTLAHRLLERFPETAAVGGPGRPGIVHRLDKDTTGALVIARTEAAYRELSRAFAEREVAKTYLGIVYGSPEPATGVIDRPIGRHPSRRKEMAVRDRGRPARTGYRRLAGAEGISLLELDLETGRTHQIRVHLKALGHPLVGDPVYGEARWRGLRRQVQPPLKRFARPALHAWRMELRHPVSGASMRFEAPVPPDLRALWEAVAKTAFPA